MASSNVSEWDEPLPASDDFADDDFCSEANKERRRDENLAKLESYVRRMAYQPAMPPRLSQRIEEIARPRRFILIDNLNRFGHLYEPPSRAKRIKRLLSKYNAITTEQMETLIRNQKIKERKRESLLRRKQEIYYELLTKLERQCRTQYLTVLIKKFSKFVAHLASTMRIPVELIDPYARMQRGIFCNILLAIGMQPTSQSAIYYTSKDAIGYDVCHRLAHALLSLIIKSLDIAATRETKNKPIDNCDMDVEMDNYIKDRLMCAAERKIINERRQKQMQSQPQQLVDPLQKCEYFHCD